MLLDCNGERLSTVLMVVVVAVVVVAVVVVVVVVGWVWLTFNSYGVNASFYKQSSPSVSV